MLKKLNVLLTGLLFIMFITLGGCSTDLDFATDDPFIVIKTVPIEANEYRYFYPRKTAVYDSGKVKKYTEETDTIKVGDDAPEVEQELSDEEVDELKEIIEKNKFFKLKKDLTDKSVMDGESVHVTVNLKDESKTVGGENPDDEGLDEIRDYTEELIEGDASKQWNEDIDDYIYETNPED